MEEGAKELVLQAFESKMKNHPEYDQLSSELSALPESSSERIFEIRDKIAVLGSILCKLIGGSALKPSDGKKRYDDFAASDSSGGGFPED